MAVQTTKHITNYNIYIYNYIINLDNYMIITFYINFQDVLLLSGDLDADEPRQPNDLDFDPRGQGSAFQSQHATCEAIRHFSCEGKLYSVFFEVFFLCATGLFSNLSNNGSVILRQSGIGHSTQLEEMIFQILLKTIIGIIPSSDAPRFWNLCVSLAFLWVSDLLVSPPLIQEIRLLILSYQRHICHICYQQM